MRAEGYLAAVLADGSTPFRRGGRIRELLGLPAAASVDFFAQVRPRPVFGYLRGGDRRKATGPRFPVLPDGMPVPSWPDPPAPERRTFRAPVDPDVDTGGESVLPVDREAAAPARPRRTDRPTERRTADAPPAVSSPVDEQDPADVQSWPEHHGESDVEIATRPDRGSPSPMTTEVVVVPGVSRPKDTPADRGQVAGPDVVGSDDPPVIRPRESVELTAGEPPTGADPVEAHGVARAVAPVDVGVPATTDVPDAPERIAVSMPAVRAAVPAEARVDVRAGTRTAATRVVAEETPRRTEVAEVRRIGVVPTVLPAAPDVVTPSADRPPPRPSTSDAPRRAPEPADLWPVVEQVEAPWTQRETRPPEPTPPPPPLPEAPPVVVVRDEPTTPAYWERRHLGRLRIGILR